MSEFNWGEFYKYDEESPTCLRFKVSRGNREAGSIAGIGRPEDRYYRLNSKYGETLVHRIIWRILKGEIPSGFVIDHIDGNTFNNKITNLRLVTLKGNAENRKLNINTSTGVKGVLFVGGINARWRATWKKEGHKRSKSFSVLKFGYERAKRLAIAYRAFVINLLNDSGSLYTEVFKEEYSKLLENNLNSYNKRPKRMESCSGVYYEEGNSPRWRATWSSERNKIQSKSFSVSKFGYEKARELALECRKLNIAEIKDRWCKI